MHLTKDSSTRTHTEDPEVTNQFAEKAQSVYHSIQIETKDPPQPAVTNSVQLKQEQSPQENPVVQSQPSDATIPTGLKIDLSPTVAHFDKVQKLTKEIEEQKLITESLKEKLDKLQQDQQ